MDKLDVIFCGPFRESPQYAEFARQNLGIKIPPMLGLARIHAAGTASPDQIAKLWNNVADSGANVGSVAFVQAKYVNGASDLGIARARASTTDIEHGSSSAQVSSAGAGAGAGAGADAGAGAGAGAPLRNAPSLL